MAGLTIDQLEFLASKGLTLDETIEFAKLGGKRSSGAVRQARYRARKKGGDVTSDVTRDASPPPIDNNHTPPVSSNEETTPAPKSNSKLGKPEGVSDPVWRDFLAHRKALKVPATETAIAGICREAEKVGWSLDDALAECVSRGWRGFKADWVAAARAPPGEGGTFADQILATQKVLSS
jgi:hypothetical protein